MRRFIFTLAMLVALPMTPLNSHAATSTKTTQAAGDRLVTRVALAKVRRGMTQQHVEARVLRNYGCTHFRSMNDADPHYLVFYRQTNGQWARIRYITRTWPRPVVVVGTHWNASRVRPKGCNDNHGPL